MFEIKFFWFKIILSTLLFAKIQSTNYNDVPDLRDVIRKEEFQNDLNEFRSFEHQNPISSQNQLIQQHNAMEQSQNGIPSLHTFKKEFPMSMQQIKPSSNKLELIIQPEETELRKTEKANEAFEKLLQFVTIMGQVDEYLSDKAQSAIKAIARISEEMNKQRNRY